MHPASNDLPDAAKPFGRHPERFLSPLAQAVAVFEMSVQHMRGAGAVCKMTMQHLRGPFGVSEMIMQALRSLFGVSEMIMQALRSLFGVSDSDHTPGGLESLSQRLCGYISRSFFTPFDCRS